MSKHKFTFTEPADLAPVDCSTTLVPLTIHFRYDRAAALASVTADDKAELEALAERGRLAELLEGKARFEATLGICEDYESLRRRLGKKFKQFVTLLPDPSPTPPLTAA